MTPHRRDEGQELVGPGRAQSHRGQVEPLDRLTAAASRRNSVVIGAVRPHWGQHHRSLLFRSDGPIIEPYPGVLMASPW